MGGHQADGAVARQGHAVVGRRRRGGRPNGPGRGRSRGRGKGWGRQTGRAEPGQGRPQERVEGHCIGEALALAEHLARGSDDHRGGQSRQLVAECEVLVGVGLQQDRDERVAGSGDDPGVGERLAIHPLTVIAPGAGELDPERATLRRRLRRGGAEVLTPGDRPWARGQGRRHGQPGPSQGEDHAHTSPNRSGFAQCHRASPTLTAARSRFSPYDRRRAPSVEMPTAWGVFPSPEKGGNSGCTILFGPPGPWLHRKESTARTDPVGGGSARAIRAPSRSPPGSRGPETLPPRKLFRAAGFGPCASDAWRSRGARPRPNDAGRIPRLSG